MEKDDEQKNIKKIYRLKYEKYLRVKPTTNSPFDLLVAASQVCIEIFVCFMVFVRINSGIFDESNDDNMFQIIR